VATQLWPCCSISSSNPKKLDGRPTLIVLDEAWVYLRDELFREYLRDWLKTLRKLNAVVVLATQNLSDIFNSAICDVVMERVQQKFCSLTRRRLRRNRAGFTKLQD